MLPMRWPGLAKTAIMGIRKVDLVLRGGRMAMMTAMKAAREFLMMRCHGALVWQSPQRRPANLLTGFERAMAGRGLRVTFPSQRPKLAGDVVSSKEDAGFDDDSDGFPSVCARLRDVQMQIESTLLEVARESSSQA